MTFSGSVGLSEEVYSRRYGQVPEASPSRRRRDAGRRRPAPPEVSPDGPQQPHRHQGRRRPLPARRRRPRLDLRGRAGDQQPVARPTPRSTTARAQNDALAVQLSQLQEQQAELRKTRAVAAELAAKFPPTADQPGLFEQVTAAAVDAGIGPDGVTTLAPTPPMIGSATGGVTADQPAVGSGTLATQTVTVSVTGTYDQTQRLLENLEQMQRAYLITSVALAGCERGRRQHLHHHDRGTDVRDAPGRRPRHDDATRCRECDELSSGE